jgi:hypothetical protein
VRVRPRGPVFRILVVLVLVLELSRLDYENEQEDEDYFHVTCHPSHVTLQWNVNRPSEPGLGANECVPSGKWCESTAFLQFLVAVRKHRRVVQREPSVL